MGSLLHRLRADNGVHPGSASPDQDCPLHTIPPGGFCVGDISDGIHLHRTQQFQLPAQGLALGPHLLQVEQSLEGHYLNLFSQNVLLELGGQRLVGPQQKATECPFGAG